MVSVIDPKDLAYSTLFTLHQVNTVQVSSFKPYFQDLPVDPYIKDRYRYRRLSRFKVVEDELIQLPHGYLFQSKKYNPLLGDVKREFDELDPGMVRLPDFQKLVLSYVQYAQLNPAEAEIGVHQIRTTCSPDNYGNPAPEGIHSDGTDFVGIFAVDRGNITGGETHLYKSKDKDPMFAKVLQPGELLLVNDREFYHYTTPIRPMFYGDGTRDVFVLTCPSLLEDFEE